MGEINGQNNEGRNSVMRSIIDLVDASLSGGGDVADAEVEVVALALPAEPARSSRPPLPGEPVVEPVVEAVVELVHVVPVVTLVVVGGVLAAVVLAGDGAEAGAWQDGRRRVSCDTVEDE